MRAAWAIDRALRRIGRAIKAAKNPRRLCPICFHISATRCRCGSYQQIDWFGETG